MDLYKIGDDAVALRTERLTSDRNIGVRLHLETTDWQWDTFICLEA